jgi:hypothetical protein
MTETKKSSLQIKSLKTTSKYRSAARAVRPSFSTRGLLPLYFFVVFLFFLFKGGAGVFRCVVGCFFVSVICTNIFFVLWNEH